MTHESYRAMDLKEMTEKLIEQEGAIVSTASLEESSIAEARSEGRLHVDENGFGFVYLDKYHILYSYGHGQWRPKAASSNGDL